ncbi:hypothetical protein, partial [Porphyromonas loveana]|uniref:hypothetical protein n=1 Tax=Porphyromonas loveana TaxID=1884669 RepID=UPI0035A1A872
MAPKILRNTRQIEKVLARFLFQNGAKSFSIWRVFSRLFAQAGEQNRSVHFFTRDHLPIHLR